MIFNLHIAFSDQQIDAVLAGEELGKYLQVDPVTPLLRVLSITCLHNGKCIEYGYTYYRVDKYTLTKLHIVVENKRMLSNHV